MEVGSKAKTNQPIKNYETFVFYANSFAIQIKDEGYTVINFDRKFGGCYGGTLFSQDSCMFVNMKFEGSKTKHAKYINQVTVKGHFDNVGALYINGTQYERYCTNNISCDFNSIPLKTYLEKAQADSSFILSAYCEDDKMPDTLVLQFWITFYYK